MHVLFSLNSGKNAKTTLSKMLTIGPASATCNLCTGFFDSFENVIPNP